MLKKVIVLPILILISFSLIIITIPMEFISNSLSTYDTISEHWENKYTPSSPSSIEILNLNVDIGNIKIKYIDPPVNYYLKIDVYIEMSGKHLAGKSYLDYFNIIWQDESSQVNFTVEFISDEWFESSLWFLQNVSIVVNIKKDVVLSIITELKDGDFEITVPFGVSIGDLKTIVSKGNLFYNFERCTIEGNITGITNEGDLELKSYNVEYTQNSNWMFNSNDTYVEIYQSIEMGANITGTAIISTGMIDLFYHDTTADIGALFPFPLSSWLIPLTQPGFEYTILDKGFFYKSNDFPTKNYYNISFYHLGGPPARNHHIEIKSE